MPDVTITLPRTSAADLLCVECEWLVKPNGQYLDPETATAYWELDEALTVALLRLATTTMEV